MGILSRITGIFNGKTVEKANIARRRFDAAAVNRFTAGWQTELNSIDNELRFDLDKLRSRSRDLANNNAIVKKWLKMCVNNIVGPQGFVLQSRVEDTPGVQDKLANDAIEKSFYAWCRVCDTSGKMGFVDLNRAIVKSLARDGEFLIRKVIGKQAGNQWGFALQLIDIDRLDTTLNQAPAEGQNSIVMGVELDSFARPVAYHIFKAHPNGYNGNRMRERVPADQIIHKFVSDRAEQTRGLPWNHAVMKDIHDLGEYDKSAMIAARKGADTLGFFVSPNGEPPIMDGEENGEPITVSVPGMYDTLPEGYDFRAYESQYPSASYGEFVKAHLRRISTGLGVSYNTLAEDLEGVNYSSIRSGVINERDEWMTLQSWMIEAFLSPLYEEWLKLALLNGAIVLPNGAALPLAKLEKFSTYYWQGRRWSWVDPLKDIEASLTAIRAGLTSPYSIAAQMGLDLEDVIADIARANALAAKSGLPEFTAMPTPAPAPAQEAPADQAAKAIDTLRAEVREFTRQPATPPVFNINPVIHTPEVRNEYTINQPSPVVNIKNDIPQQAAPIVNVAAPEVRVDVAAPEVNVEAIMPEQKTPIVQVELPARKTETNILRDSVGNMTSVTQIETSVH